MTPSFIEERVGGGVSVTSWVGWGGSGGRREREKGEEMLPKNSSDS